MTSASRQTLCAVALLSFSALAGGQEPASLGAQIEAIASPSIERHLLSGVLLVVKDDERVFERAFGYANWELEVRNTMNTRFGIGSISKSFNQNLVTELLDQGVIELQDAVDKYLDGFPKWQDRAAPSIEQLLDHRAGVPHRVTEPMEEGQSLSAADVVARVRRVGLQFEPGSERLYSSAGYTSLARVLEVASGQRYESLLEEHVFAPAKMRFAISETGQRLMPRRASPYRLGVSDREIRVKSAPYRNLRYLTGAGGVYATADDLVHYIRAVRAGTFGTAAAAMLDEGDPGTWHGIYGRTNGYEASVDVLAEPDIVFVLLTNLQSAATGELRAQIKSILQRQPAERLSVPPPVVEPFEDPASILGSYGPARISLVNGQLFRGENEFYPTEDERYYIPGSGTYMRFVRDGDGQVTGLGSRRANGSERVLARTDAD